MTKQEYRRINRWIGYAVWLSACQATPAAAHEFWLEATNYQPRRGEIAQISIRIGENFIGDSFPYVHEESKRLTIVTWRGELPIRSVTGDDPAITMKVLEPGLTVFAHKSAMGLVGSQDVRCAKLLMNVDGGEGGDRLIGMALELVTERNPYKLGNGEPLPVRLFYEGTPLPNMQIFAVSKAHPERRTIVRTDTEGRASVDLPEAGAWLLNAVHMVELQDDATARWQSFHSSMTFTRP